MRVIKLVVLSFLGLFFFNCTDDRDEITVNERFVRFSVNLDNQDRIVEAPEIPNSPLEISEYDSEGVFTIKLPVKLTQPGNESVQVQFTANSNLVEGVDYSLAPANRTLDFANGNLIDTVVIRPLRRFQQADSLVLQLSSVSDAAVNLGYRREQNPLDKFVLRFVETENLPFTFTQNRREINGEAGERFNFDVFFPLGFLPDEIEDVALFSQLNAFGYTVTEVANNGSDRITFEFTNTNDLVEDQAFSDVFMLQAFDGYTVGTIANLQVIKPLLIERSGVPANNWYNVSDTFYRNFGENYRVVGAGCEWRNWNAFALPVPVAAGSEFDADGDGYHDFRFGFVSPNAPLGTNPFDLRRIFDGESINSPGLNLVEAIEFFPAGGDSPTQGTVQVVPQIMTLIRTSDDASFDFPIRGTGTYSQIDANANVWRIILDFELDLSVLGLPNQTRRLYIYNQDGQPEPTEIPSECLPTIEL